MTRPPISGVEVFLAIVREGSLRAAARSLGVGAPAVSHRLRALERRIGVDLLVRITRSLELTAAGRALLTRAAPAFEELTVCPRMQPDGLQMPVFCASGAHVP